MGHYGISQEQWDQWITDATRRELPESSEQGDVRAHDLDKASYRTTEGFQYSDSWRSKRFKRQSFEGRNIGSSENIQKLSRGLLGCFKLTSRNVSSENTRSLEGALVVGAIALLAAANIILYLLY